jgi:hypothetical protein
MAHGNARLTPLGRQLLVGRIERQGWTITAAAAPPASAARPPASGWPGLGARGPAVWPTAAAGRTAWSTA